MLRIRPVRRAQPILKRVFLPRQILLRRIRNRHEARINAEPGRFAFRTEVVVRCSRVPEEQVAWFSADFDPFAVAGGEPFHAIFSEAVPLGCPGWYAFFVFHVTVEGV